MKEIDIREIIESMESYIEHIKDLPKNEAYLLAKKNLMESGIIDENCELRDIYKSTN